MNKLPIKNVKPTKIGNSHYFLIPAQYITNEALDLNKEYTITINDIYERIKNSKPIKIGNSHYFLIPAEYITKEALDLNKEYTITFED